jgi:hypothetical protein
MRLASGPGIGFDEGFQGGMRDDLMGGHNALDGVPDAGEAELALRKALRFWLPYSGLFS